MIPGEYFVESGEIVLNADRPTTTLTVANQAIAPSKWVRIFIFMKLMMP
jgi:urease beta subunit